MRTNGKKGNYFWVSSRHHYQVKNAVFT